MVVVLLYVLVVLALQTASAVPYCPDGWQLHDHYCYQLRGNTSFTAEIWVAARHDCRSNMPKGFNGFLVSIHSSAEQEFVKQLIRKTVGSANMQSVFIGMSSRTSRGGYRWSDGSPVSYTHWRRGFVTGTGKQCISMETTSEYWNDRNCDDASAYICKGRKVNDPVPTPAPPTPANVYCDKDWKQYGDRCYKYALEPAIYTTAHSNCQNFSNAELLSINSVYEQAYILSTLRNSNNIWLGLNDRVTEGEYLWTDGSNVTFTDWGFGEPNSRGADDDCVELITNTGLWNDRVCTGALNYICETGAKSETKPPTSKSECQTGWQSYNGHCYWFNATASKTFFLAKSYCVSQHSHLVHINDIYENAYIASQYPLVGGKPLPFNRSSHFWIGLNDIKTVGVHTWTDNQPVEMTSWMQGEPDDHHQLENCTELFVLPSSQLVNGIWNGLICNVSMGLICEKRAANVPTDAPLPTVPSSGNCTDGLIRFDNYCYKFDLPLRLSWTEAQQRCRQYGAHLISIHSMDELKFVIQQAKKAGFIHFMWIGLNDRNLEGGYVWADGTPVQFTNWQNGEPNDDFGQEDCIAVDLSDATKGWGDQSCGMFRYFGCKIKFGIDLLTPNVTVIPPYVGDPCPNIKTTYSHGPYCYTFIEKVSNWTDASGTCKRRFVNGSLVSITSLDEEEFLLDTVKSIHDTALTSHTWIGLNDKAREGIFQWSDKTPVDFIYWDCGGPNNANDKDCVEMVSGQYWISTQCSNQFSYICKYPRPGYHIPPPYHVNVSISGSCPVRWKTFGSYCYQANRTVMTWPDAKKACTRAGGHLTSILSTAESAFITDRVLQKIDNAWIGLNDRDNEHTFVWSDASPVLIVSWWRFQPNDFDGQENCVFINRTVGGQWEDASCGSKRPFVCKRPKIPYPTTASPLPPVYSANCATTYKRCLQSGKGYCQRVSCPNNCHQSSGGVFGWQIYSGESSVCTAAVQAGLTSSTRANTVIDVVKQDGRDFYSSANQNGILSKSQGQSNVSFTFHFPSDLVTCGLGWVLNDQSCYLIVANSSTSSRSWSQAKDVCSSINGAYLLTIYDRLEQQFIQSQLSKDAKQGVWIGLSDREDHGSFVWTDGLPSNFRLWAEGQPNDSQHCVLVNPSGDQAGYWTTALCNSNAGYICEKSNEGPAPTRYPNGRGGCPSGWVSVDSSCYLWATLPDCTGSECFLSWSDARNSCQAMNPGADLISIDSAEELKVAQYEIPRLGWGLVWIGLNDIKDEGKYVWSDGASVTESGLDWARGQPDGKSSTQKCVVMLHDGTMSDQSCARKFAYGCEIQPHPSRASGGGLSSGVIAVIVIVILSLLVVVVIVIRRRIKGGGYAKTDEKGALVYESDKMRMTHCRYGTDS